MTTTHTPGPWRASMHIVYAGPHHRVTTVEAVGLQGEADAQLIATAPDLLAALKVMTDFAEGVIQRAKLTDTNGIVDASRAIIARAEGRD
jgi:hypothetical protein